MNQKLLTTLLLTASVGATFAADPPLASGYYRVKNYKTDRYIYVYDNTGEILAASATAEVGAISLLKNHDRTISDPASVLYANYVGGNGNGGFSYDVESQGTSLHGIIGYYVSIYRTPSKHLNIYASVGSLTKYLDDDEMTAQLEKGQLGFLRTGDYRLWDEQPIDASGDNYFGVAPTLKANDKYYQSFFASFPFSFASNGMKAYYIKHLDAKLGVAVIEELKDEVPGAMPVIVECSSEQPTDNRLNLLRNDKTPLKDNLLKGVYFNNPNRPSSKDARTKNDKATMRLLAADASGNLVYKVSDADYLPANQSYLVVPEGTPEEVLVMDETAYKEYVTNHPLPGPESINQVRVNGSAHTIYSVNGSKLTDSNLRNLSSGIYVVDGKKVVLP